MEHVIQRFERVGVSGAHACHQKPGVFVHSLTLRITGGRALERKNALSALLDSFSKGPNGVAMRELIERLQSARSVLALTGSGISAESGLPTFRGVGGMWRTHRVEELASPEGFARNPELVWTWYNERSAAHRRAQPNAGHFALAQLETLYRDFTLATQNVDSLHLRAGSRRLLELHGNLRTARCTHCAFRHALDATGLPLDRIGHACGGMLRPDIVWFGEPLPAEVWSQAAEAAERADVILVVGTSAVVYPAAALATHYARDAFIAEVNPEETAISGRVDAVIRASAAKALPALLTALETDR
jgi:NAD-dependent deacetylase